MQQKKDRRPVHPGQVFNELVIAPQGITIKKVAEDLGVSRITLSKVINEQSALSLRMAHLWAMYTGTTIESWYQMQVNLDVYEYLASKGPNVDRPVVTDIVQSELEG